MLRNVLIDALKSNGVDVSKFEAACRSNLALTLDWIQGAFEETSLQAASPDTLKNQALNGNRIALAIIIDDLIQKLRWLDKLSESNKPLVQSIAEWCPEWPTLVQPLGLSGLKIKLQGLRVAKNSFILTSKRRHKVSTKYASFFYEQLSLAWLMRRTATEGKGRCKELLEWPPVKRVMNLEEPSKKSADTWWKIVEKELVVDGYFDIPELRHLIQIPKTKASPAYVQALKRGSKKNTKRVRVESETPGSILEKIRLAFFNLPPFHR